MMNFSQIENTAENTVMYENDGTATGINRNSIYILALMLVSVGLTGIVPQPIISILILAGSLCLLPSNNVYLAFPIMAFYYEPLGTVFGLSTYRWFTFIYLFCYYIHNKRKVSVPVRLLVPIGLYAYFSLAALSLYNVRVGMAAFFDVVIIFLVTKNLSNANKAKAFFSVFPIVAIFSFFSGIRMQNIYSYDSILSNVLITLTRNKATFEDPNYMGYFFTVAIFSVVSFKPFKKWINISLVVVLYLMLFTSVSITAIVVNILIWIGYLSITRKVTPRNILMIALIVVALLVMFFVVLRIGDRSNPLVQMALRIKQKITEISIGNSDTFTSNRTALAREHLEIFAKQPILRKLFGLNPVCPVYVNTNVFAAAAHNEYVDWLHNIGLVGALLMSAYVIRDFVKAIRKYKANASNYHLSLVLLKAIWILYAFTLTTFMDWRFMIPILI